MLRLIVILAGVVTLQAQTWTQRSSASGNSGWNALRVDPVLGKPFIHALRNTSQGTIYSSDYTYFDLSSTLTSCVQAGGNGSANDSASAATQDTSGWLRDRHPYYQTAPDSDRGLLWVMGGANGNGFSDFGYEVFRATVASGCPTANTWTWLYPYGGSGPSLPDLNVESSMIYDSNVGALVLIGPSGGNYFRQWIYCPTVPVGGGTPTGTLETKQAAVCTAADTWERIDTGLGNGGANPFAAGSNIVYVSSTLIYVPERRISISFGGVGQGYASLHETWKFDLSSKTWTRLCQSPCVDPPATSGHFAAITYDSRRGGIWYHSVTGSAGADYFYAFATDTWTATGTGGETDVWTTIAYDATNDKLLSVGHPSGSSMDVWTATLPPAMVYVGKGCTTAYFIDNDCDGHGVAVRADGNYTTAGNVGDMPDADDNDPAVSTVADWRTKYGSGPTDKSQATLLTFLLRTRGYAPTRVWFISPTGDDATCMAGGADIDHPCATSCPLASTYHDGAGGMIVYRGGDYVYTYNPSCSTHQPSATNAASPLIFIAYPGEKVTVSAPSGWFSYSNSYWPYYSMANVIIDGLIHITPSGSDCMNLLNAAGFIVRNNEFTRCGDTGLRANNHIWNLLVEGNVFHDASSHGIYLGYSSPDGVPHGLGVDFDFAQDAANYQCYLTGSCAGGAVPSTGADQHITFRNNLVYRNGNGGYEGIHFNSYINDIVVDSNIIHSGGGTGIGFQSGVYHAVVKNNLIFNNHGCAITFSQYNGDVQAATHRYNSILNNTMWNGIYTSSYPTCGIYLTDYTGNSGTVTATYGSHAVIWKDGAYGGNDRFAPTWPNGTAITINGVVYHISSVADTHHLTLTESYSDATCVSGCDYVYTVSSVDGNHYMKDFTIANNIIAVASPNSGSYGSASVPFEMMRSSYPASHTIANNLIWRTDVSWVSVSDPVMTQVANSTPGSTPTGGTSVLLSDGVTTEYRYTLAQAQAWNSAWSTTTVGDPSFASASPASNSTPWIFDFRLTAGSPAINTGTSAVAMDILGKYRDAQPDIGAYELNGLLAPLSLGGYSGSYRGTMR